MMTGAALAAMRKTAIEAIPGISITDDAELSAFLLADSTAIVEYLQSEAQVAPGTFEVSGYGVVSGLGGPLE